MTGHMSFCVYRYSWLKDGQLLPVATQPNLDMPRRDGTLKITASDSDAGYYQCRANNSLGLAVTVKVLLEKAGQLM